MILENNLDDADRQQFADVVDKMLRATYEVERVRAIPARMTDQERSHLAEQGLFGLIVPSAFEGVGGGIADAAAICRLIGRSLSPLSFTDTAVATYCIARLGSEPQKQMLLPQIAAGTLRVAIAFQEPASENAQQLDFTTVAREARLTGTKTFVFDAEGADLFLVFAKVANSQTGVFLVPANSEGLTSHLLQLPDNRLAATLVFDDVAGDALQSDDSALRFALDMAAILAASETLGAIEMLNEITVEYAKTRRQFGQPIGHFQAIQHRLVDMYMGQRGVDPMIENAIGLFEDSENVRQSAVSAAKIQADRVGRSVGQGAIQIHGGMGMTDECWVGHYLKRILTNGARFGTADCHLERYMQLNPPVTA